MIKSMTGFGRATITSNDISVSVEVKSLNSKFLDLSVKLPRIFSEKELDVRNWVTEKLERGKITINVEVVKPGREEVRQSYNESLFVAYYTQLKRLADRVMAPYDNLLQMAINSPDVIQSGVKEEANPEEWEMVKECTAQAIEQCDQFRRAEGDALQSKLVSYSESIESGLAMAESLDPKRIEKVRNRIKGRVEDFFGEEGFDANRLEQEIIFYIEKLDIHEERVRLKTHLDYFQQVLESKSNNGKKLAFISQEIGREINTIGSKANDAEIQKHVVMMKEELEKIKEQLGNVL